MKWQRQGGFTLLELMIVVVVIAILASLAYYNFSRYAYRARRSEGQQFLQQIAAAEERYYTTFNQYTANITGASPNGLAFNSATSDNGYYTVTVSNLGANNQSFTLTATPNGVQANDQCGSLILDNLQQKSANPGNTSNGKCW
jgi:type IV pilus assembly protein PilE